MNAIPLVFPISVRLPESKTVPALEGVMGELVSVSRVVESDNSVMLNVVARDKESAIRRAQESFQGQVLEVGEPTPLQKFSKNLPYRRSFIMTRYKRGRYQQQGGGGSHQPAATPSGDLPSGTGVGMGVAEELEAFLGEKQIPPGLLRWVNDYKKMRQYGNVSGAKQIKNNIDAEIKKLGLNAKDVYGDDPTPKGESVENTTLESALRGYPTAMEFHKRLSEAPREWIESDRGRKTIMSGISNIRLSEGNTPADALENAYLDNSLIRKPLGESNGSRGLGDGVQTIQAPRRLGEHKIRVKFASPEHRAFALNNVYKFSEACCNDCEEEENEAVLTVRAPEREMAEDHVRDLMTRLNLRPFSEVARG